MRNYLFLLLSLLLFSCQLDPLDENTHLEKIPVFEIQIPDNLLVNVKHTISFKYKLNNGCYSFYEIEYDETSENVRVITAFAEVALNEACAQGVSIESKSFDFTPDQSKTYLFKFWIDQNDNGIDLFEEFELVVE